MIIKRHGSWGTKRRQSFHLASIVHLISPKCQSILFSDAEHTSCDNSHTRVSPNENVCHQMTDGKTVVYILLLQWSPKHCTHNPDIHPKTLQTVDGNDWILARVSRTIPSFRLSFLWPYFTFTGDNYSWLWTLLHSHECEEFCALRLNEQALRILYTPCGLSSLSTSQICGLDMTCWKKAMFLAIITHKQDSGGLKVSI